MKSKYNFYNSKIKELLILSTYYGINEAIFLLYLNEEIKINKQQKNCYAENYYWVNKPVSEIAKDLPFISYGTIIRAIKNLRHKEVIIAENHNPTPYDRSLWYRINHDLINIG